MSAEETKNRKPPFFSEEMIARGKRYWLYTVAGVLAVITSYLLGLEVNRAWGLALNESHSLPQTLFFMEKQRVPGRYDYLIFTADKQSRYFKPDQRFAKIVGGVGGDLAFIQDGNYAVRNHETGEVRVIGKILATDSKGTPLKPGPTGVIPADYFLVYGLHPDSFDSRYAEMGWIPKDHVVAKAHPIF